jgi:CRISPR/Cas system CSM-associated protein Csm2 small subunit
MDQELEWTNEKLEKVPYKNWLYRLFCLATFRKRMSYKEMYLILSEINRKIDGEEKAKKRAFERIIEFYEYNNGNRPV